MKLSIIIVNYNTGRFLVECLKSIRSNPGLAGMHYETIVVDNHSGENITSLISTAETTRLIINRKNLGFARANNIGIRESRGDFVLLLNPDTQVDSLDFRQILSYLETHPDTGIVSPFVRLINGKIDDACHRGFPTPWRALTHFSGLGKLFPHSQAFNGYHLGYRNLDTVHEIDACVGACMFIRRVTGDEAGWLDEDYFWYGEDIDFCYRVKKLGFRVVFYPHTEITHYKGVSSGIKSHSRHLSTADISVKKQSTRARFAAMRTFYLKHYQRKYPRWMTELVFKGIRIFEFAKGINL